MTTITVKLLPRPSGAAWADWLKAHPAPMTVWESRRIIRPRLLLVHTNGAANEGTAAAAYNWSMAAPSNTKAHYQVDRDGTATQFLPTDREGIANYKASMFSTAIETADEGWGPGKPGNAGGFTDVQAETVAVIIAMESEKWGYPTEYPTAWDGTGVAAHTEPFGYPYWTNSVGKPCPGTQKKLELRTIIMPRARELRHGASSPRVDQPKQPIPTNTGDDDMANIGIIHLDDADAVFIGTYVGPISGPRFLDLHWVRDTATSQAASAHVLAGATVFGGNAPTTGAARLVKANVKNCFVDVLPTGDNRTTWTAADFASVVT